MDHQFVETGLLQYDSSTTVNWLYPIKQIQLIYLVYNCVCAHIPKRLPTHTRGRMSPSVILVVVVVFGATSTPRGVRLFVLPGVTDYDVCAA